MIDNLKAQIKSLEQQLTQAYRQKYPVGTVVTWAYSRNGPLNSGTVLEHSKSRTVNTMKIEPITDGWTHWINARHFL